MSGRVQSPQLERRFALHLPAGVRKADRLVYALPLATAALAAVVGAADLAGDSFDALSAPVLGLLGLSLLAAAVLARRETPGLEREAMVLLTIVAAAMALLALLPAWIYGWNLNAIISRTAISTPIVLLLSTAVGAYSLKSILGGTPGARDIALYPWLALPIVLALVAYGLALGKIVTAGLGGLSLDVLTRAWLPGATAADPGLLNQILGTLLLMTMSLLFAFLPGVGAGVFMAEYPGRVASLVNFSVQMLRAVSLFVVGAAVFGIIEGMNSWDPSGLVSQLVRGSHTDPGGITTPDRGSFLVAAIFVALIVVPVIAKLTEEGLRSVPQELREGSVALGAGDAFGLRRVLLPWAAPNILTGLLIAGAEANGSLAVIMFLAGHGEYGVGPTSGVTSLDFAIFGSRWGETAYVNTMKPYGYTAALLLLVLTVGLTIGAMLLQRRFAKRYRGSMTAN